MLHMIHSHVCHTLLAQETSTGQSMAWQHQNGRLIMSGGARPLLFTQGTLPRQTSADVLHVDYSNGTC